ncbi:hypothetical protein EZV62_014514 [Acer yangbiense]|uniref:FLZ-type domain-containing protein n=1 Tax=Acer yangbiense TaxID=1000413 RepID=A0A5C7HSD7_9ROSI|nr:hypothetical protein EZV62_014514 [Acer yangbiense]
MKPSSLPNKLQYSRPVFTVSPLEVIEESVDHINVSGKPASFLEKCHFCKKRIPLTRDDVFMDGYGFYLFGNLIYIYLYRGTDRVIRNNYVDKTITKMSPLEVIEESVDRINVSGKLASFLEKCHFCKKRILTRDDVFMDGCMRGFCSTDCRDKQIATDKFSKPYDYKDPKGDINIDNMKGSNLKNKASGSRSR